MSARQELHESMCGSCAGNFARGECESVDRAIDAFAHELAEERLRTWGQDGEARLRGDQSSPFLMWEDADRAADLIDPEVA